MGTPIIRGGINIFHGYDLGIASSCYASFDPEDRSQGGFAQGVHYFFTYLGQTLAQADGGDGFVFAQRGRGNGSDDDVFGLRSVFESL
jgi:hypothetical protein